MAASFPGSNPSDSTLWVAANFISNTLNGSHDNSTNIITVLDTTGFPSSGYVVVSTEVIKYTSTSGTTFKNCTRGADGSSAAAHSSGVTLYHNWVADHHNALKDEIVAIATNLTNRFGGHATNITVAQLGAAGTVTNPQYSFSGDPDTGIYNSSANEFNISTQGVKAISILPSAQNQQIRIGSSDGSAATPVLAFHNATTTGIYTDGSNNFNITREGVAIASFDGSSTSGHTRFLIYDVDNATVERVSIGIADSGGANFKLLRIPN